MAKAHIDVSVEDHGWRGRRPECAIKLSSLTTPCMPLFLRTVRSGSSAPPLLSQDVAGRPHAIKPTSRTLLATTGVVGPAATAGVDQRSTALTGLAKMDKYMNRNGTTSCTDRMTALYCYWIFEQAGQPQTQGSRDDNALGLFIRIVCVAELGYMGLV